MNTAELIDRLYQIIEEQNKLLKKQSELLQLHEIMDPAAAYQLPDFVKEAQNGFYRQI